MIWILHLNWLSLLHAEQIVFCDCVLSTKL